jgi:hypothetical protein
LPTRWRGEQTMVMAFCRDMTGVHHSAQSRESGNPDFIALGPRFRGTRGT